MLDLVLGNDVNRLHFIFIALFIVQLLLFEEQPSLQCISHIGAEQGNG